MSVLIIITSLLFFLSASGQVQAIYSPESVSNNKVGVHILFPEEIETAAKLVNNAGAGSWGYVTIPIQATDRNRERWQKFLDRAKELKVVPMIRIATVPQEANWVKPDNFDLIDFANFLGDLEWPIANRYVIIFNEVNRSDEYGGFVKPEDYADILANASDIFKRVSSDFFILPAGLDNAAPNSNGFMHHRRYIERMYLHRPDIFDKIDGWTSHAYPNPDFSARPDKSGNNKIDSFRYDLRLIRQFTTKKLPVFITETGWSNRYLTDMQIAYYYKYAFEKVWCDAHVVAITPFLLEAREGPFVQFSLIGSNGQPTESALAFSSFASMGTPTIPEIREIASTALAATSSAVPEQKSQPSYQAPQLFFRLFNIFTSLFGTVR